MSQLINSIGLYFLLPIYIALALLISFFNIPESYYFGIFIYYAITTIPVLFSMLFFPSYIHLKCAYSYLYKPPIHKITILLLCILIIILMPLDIYFNGFKLLNPGSYTEFYGPGRYIRHITDLCFILIPVALIMLRSSPLKMLFISIAIIFPILIIDRNRLLMSCYSLILCMILASRPTNESRTKHLNYILLSIVAMCCIIVFSIVGHYRSGNAFLIQSSGTFLKEGQLPLTDIFTLAPKLLQQVILYITTPLFNFATIVSTDFINPDLLLSQISPFNRDAFDAYPYIPILVPRFNVGTELFPFLLYGGLSMALLAFLGILFVFLCSFYFVRQHCNIFTILIFIKTSYCALFVGFAPQFYILLNMVYITLMFFLWFISDLLMSFIEIIRQRQ